MSDKIDAEIKAIRSITRTLSGLSKSSQVRVLNYISSANDEGEVTTGQHPSDVLGQDDADFAED